MISKKIRNISKTTLSKQWATLFRVNYEYLFKNNTWKHVSRECYDRGDGAAILLYNPQTGHIILTKQFRMPTYQNTQQDGMSIEVCAGVIDANEDPKSCIIREVKEEVGYAITNATKVLEAYSSPGAVTEKMYLFVAPYSNAMKCSFGGGLETENEEIEVLEIPFSEAIMMMNKGEIKDLKTIALLQHAQNNKLL